MTQDKKPPPGYRDYHGKQTPSRGTPIPSVVGRVTSHRAESPRAEDFAEEVTGNYEGEDLQRMREQRLTPARFKRLEKRADVADQRHVEMLGEIGDMKLTLGRLDGTVGGLSQQLPNLIKEVQDANKMIREREHVTFTSKVEIEGAKQKAEVEVKAEAEKAELKKSATTRETILEVLKLAGKVVPIILAAGGLGAWLHSCLGGH